MDRPRLLNRRSLLGLGAAAAGSLVVPGCSRGRSDEPAPDGPGRLATGNKGGVYSMYGAGLAKLVTEVTGVTMQAIPSEGSVENLQMLAGQKVDLAFSLSDSAFDAYEGVETFKSGALRFTALARTYDNYVHVVVPTASSIDKITDLEGAVVSIGPKASGTKVVADRILQTANVPGVKTVTYALEDAVAALKDKAERGKASKNGIDALIWSGGLPTVPIRDLQKTIGFRLVDIGSVAEKIALKRFGGYVLSSIPPSVYSLASSVPTLAVPNYLLARRGLSDSWAWWTLNTLFRRQHDLMQIFTAPDGTNPLAGVVGSLDARSAIATMPIPLHQAAERWYRTNHI
jgi:TRAP transporter TAXI family solute receptor